ncbi:MAG: hypothetical protein O7E52_06315 [Candidatus Poribacteria bacterium]|nr:hypothetical protein [Candidatus Poribacteria bacterium]
MSTSYKPVKLTPLHSIAQRLNAQFVELRRWAIPEAYRTPEAEIAAARSGVVLADETPNGKLMIEGDLAEAVLRAAFDLPEVAISSGARIESAQIYRLRQDLFFASVPPGGENALRKRLTAAVQESEQFITVTDITHGRSEIRIIGPASQALLSKVCGLDFHPSAFPDGVAKQSSLAKTLQLIIRRDMGELPAFSIIGVRSLGAYVWDTIMDAGREWELAPIGHAALGALEAN